MKIRIHEMLSIIQAIKNNSDKNIELIAHFDEEGNLQTLNNYNQPTKIKKKELIINKHFITLKQ